MTINNNVVLKKVRQQLGQTQAELASSINDALGRAYDKSIVSRWESGKENIPGHVLSFVKDKMMKPRTVAIANNKGGVGKTTTACNLAVCLAYLGFRVALIDADAQGNSSMALGVNQFDLYKQGKTLESVLRRDGETTDINDALIKPFETDEDHNDLDLWLLASSLYLNAVERSLQGQMSWETMLKRALSQITMPLDFIVIDCPPTLGFMMANACIAADDVLIPCEPGSFAVQGVEMVRESLNEYRASGNPNLQVLGILPTRFAVNLAEHKHQLGVLNDNFAVKPGYEERGGWHIYSPVPRRTAYEQADDSGKPLFLHLPNDPDTAVYRTIAADLAERAGRSIKGGRK